MNLKKTVIACGLASLCAASVAHAEISANVGVTSNYLWRGVSQTGDAAAVSGGVDWSAESGLYAGTWISNIDWGVGSGAEVDFYGGYANEVGDFGYDVGLIYYYYPDSDYDDSNFTEVYLNGSWNFLSAGIAYTLTGDADDDSPWSDGDLYYYIGASFDVAPTWSAGLTAGYYDFDVPSSSDVDYSHFQADLTKSMDTWGDFTLTVSKAEEESGDDDTKFVVSWSKSF